MRLKWKYLLGASLVAAMASTASVGWSSSHREAPGTAGKPRIDSTDFYMFRSYEPGRQKYVTLIANYLPLQHPYGGPNYFVLDNDAVYEIHVDNNGDAVEDMTFQFDFDTRLANRGKGITLKRAARASSRRSTTSAPRPCPTTPATPSATCTRSTFRAARRPAGCSWGSAPRRSR